MSFLNSGDSTLTLHIKQGYSYGPRTFTYQHGDDYDPPNEIFENDGFEAQLEVTCTKGGEAAFVANTEDSGGMLSIDPDEIIISFEMDPEQTDDLDFSCCQFVLFIYKGDVDDPTDKIPLVHGDFEVKVLT